MKLLLVEDEESHSTLVRRAFQSQTLETELTIVQTLKQANEVLARSLPDIVICDLILPDGKGIELLPKDTESQRFPFIVMTSYGDEQIAVDAIKAGALDYIVKSESTLLDLPHVAERAMREWQLIVARKRAEQSLRRVNRTLQALSACNEILVRANLESSLLQQICRIIIDISEYRYVWVGYTHKGGEQALNIVAQAGFEQHKLKSATTKLSDYECEKGITSSAIKNNNPCVFRRILTDDRHHEHRPIAREYNFQSSIALPLITSGKVLGVLNIYADSPDAFDDEEVQFLMELADNMAFGITTLRDRKERELLQSQLQQAQKMEAIGHLTGGIAHDFNNILASIMGYTGLAIDRYASNGEGKLAEYLNEVFLAGERARDLIGQMLTFSRGGESKPKSISLQDSVKDALKMLQGSLPRSIVLQMQINSDVPNILMDPVKLHQIIMNLCINARDAMDGHGTIDLAVRIAEGLNVKCASCGARVEGNFIELAVRDTGHGVEEHCLEKIFDPFFTTKEVGKGTGMGLSMVHGIVHDNKGHIIVTSLAGKGAEFRILFVEGTSIPSNDENGTSNSTLHIEDVRKCRIMVVDDEHAVANFIGEYLEQKGFSVKVLTESRAALKLLSKDVNAFDLIITDMMMPGMTGLEFTKKIRKLRTDLSIVLCTGYSDSVHDKEIKAMNISGVLNKPIDTNTMHRLVRELLQTKTK